MDKETVELILLVEKCVYVSFFLYIGWKVLSVHLWARREERKHRIREKRIEEARELLRSDDEADRARGKELMLLAWDDDPEMQRTLLTISGESEDSLNN